MEIFTKVVKNYWPLLILGLITYLSIWPTLMPGYFSHHDDLQVMRIFEMRKCFADLQIPCRWVPDMGYGYGFPLFNYYSALPYYIGAFLSFLVGYIGAAKILFLIPLVTGIAGMYLLASEIFDEFIAVLPAVLYGLAPYRALDSYVRGDVAESWALSLVPFLFFLSLKLVKTDRKKYLILFSLTLGGFLMTHNIMTMLFLPWLIVWVILQMRNVHFKNYPRIILGLGLGVGLAAFFLLPAFLEKNLVQVESLTQGDLNFRAHFVTLEQLFISRFWGYGASVPGTNDTISFQIGWPLWWLVAISLVYQIWQSIKKRKINLAGVFFLAMFIFSIFMTHTRSAFIWERVTLLPFVQFPWRFLGLAVFSGSLLSAIFLEAVGRKYLFLVIVGLTSIIILLNANYFKPEIFYPDLADQQKLSGYEFEQQQKAAILDYLPKGIPKPIQGAPGTAEVVSGQAQIFNFQNHSNFWSFNVQVFTPATVNIPIFDFPNWTTYVNSHKFNHQHNNYFKTISLNFEPGNYTVEGRLENTNTRTVANLVTIMSVVILVGLSLWKKSKV